MSKLTISILGNAETCRTEAEISWLHGSVQVWVGLVYETAAGWQTEIIEDCPAELSPALLQKATDQAKARLGRYVNRRGENPPEGLNAMGLSLWLTQKSDNAES